ncbi:CopG family transcriptional regulator [Chloroflexota bacterium]
METKVTIKIPRELYRKLSQMVEGTGFSSVNEFIVFVMRTVASGGEITGEDRLTAKEVAAIRERLKRLGYLKEEE